MSDIREFCPLWGEWELDRKLGEGSFGDVWKIKRNVVGGRVYYAAVKHISIPKDDSEIKRLIGEGVFTDEQSAIQYYDHMLQSIMNEIDAMHKLQGYTNIVSYEDHKVIPRKNGIGYDLLLRMELLTPLTERIRYTMKVSDVVSLGKDIATAIHILDKHHMIHRDIKPQNIFVNDQEVYKLGDYGTARALGTGATAMSRKGTYNYMSPEIYHGQKADTRADIYSLGLVLYRLLNGNRLPFLPTDRNITSTDSDRAVARRVSGETLPPPKYADGRLSAIVLKACAFDPNNRYQNAMELCQALEAYQGKAQDPVSIEKERTADNSYTFDFSGIPVSVPKTSSTEKSQKDSAEADIQVKNSSTDIMRTMKPGSRGTQIMRTVKPGSRRNQVPVLDRTDSSKRVYTVPSDTTVFTAPSENSNRSNKGPEASIWNKLNLEKRKWILIAVIAMLVGVVIFSLLLGGSNRNPKPTAISAGGTKNHSLEVVAEITTNPVTAELIRTPTPTPVPTPEPAQSEEYDEDTEGWSEEIIFYPWEEETEIPTEAPTKTKRPIVQPTPKRTKQPVVKTTKPPTTQPPIKTSTPTPKHTNPPPSKTTKPPKETQPPKKTKPPTTQPPKKTTPPPTDPPPAADP